MSRCNKSRLRRRIGEQDLSKITARIPGVGKLSSKLLKQTLQVVAGGVALHFSGVVLSYARDVLRTPLINHAYSKDVALVRFQFKPEAAIRLSYTNDLAFGLRVVVYAEQNEYKYRIENNSKAIQLSHPPSRFSVPMRDFISLAEAEKYKVFILERAEGFVVQATKVVTVLGFKTYVICELAFANEGQVMFRHADGD